LNLARFWDVFAGKLSVFGYHDPPVRKEVVEVYAWQGAWYHE
jgi:hypothetical protein